MGKIIVIVRGRKFILFIEGSFYLMDTFDEITDTIAIVEKWKIAESKETLSTV